MMTHLNLICFFSVCVVILGIQSGLLQSPNWKEHFTSFCHHYKEDLRDCCNLDTEQTVWQYHWERQRKAGKDIPSTVQATLPATDPDLFPNILRAFQILAVVPITTCECERSVSTLRRLKTYLRNTMSQDRLTGLALMHVHRNLHVNIEDIMGAFAERHPCRMEFSDFMQEK